MSSDTGPSGVAMAKRQALARDNAAKAICLACGQTPDHQGDASGNAERWPDYLPIADAAIAALRRDGYHQI